MWHAHRIWIFGSLGRGEARSATQHGALTHSKLAIVLYYHTSHHLLCCEPIGVGGINVCLHPIREYKVQEHSSPGRWKPVSYKMYFQAPPWENFSYCAPVGDVGLWASHYDLVVSFSSSSLSESILDLNTWDNMGEAKEESPKHIKDSDNRISAMVFDAPKLE